MADRDETFADPREPGAPAPDEGDSQLDELLDRLSVDDASLERVSLDERQRRYRPGEVLGRGGTAEVRAVFDTRLRRHVAVKTLIREPRKRTVEQLARECGFGSYVSMYAAFKRHTGETFAAYRRTHKGHSPAAKDG